MLRLLNSIYLKRERKKVGDHREKGAGRKRKRVTNSNKWNCVSFRGVGWDRAVDEKMRGRSGSHSLQIRCDRVGQVATYEA